MPGTYEFVVDGAAMAELLRSPSGPVGRHLIERCTVVQMAARRQAPRRTGCLQDSIVKRAETFGGELAMRIQSDTTSCSPSRTSYSLFVHEGTAAHDIYAKAGGVLAFQVGGQTVFATHVHHPGTKPNHFLSDNLHLAIA